MDPLATFRSKVGFVLAVLLAHVAPATLIAQQPLPVSKGVYRLPYADGTSVRFSNDHTNHPTTLNRVDMTGQGTGPFTVVAAAAGWVRIIVENNDTTCPNACGVTMTTPENDCNGDGTTTTCDHCTAQNNACGGYAGPSSNCCERDVPAGMNCTGCTVTPAACTCPGNNHVWIEHSNGEWTKYTHLQRGSVGPGPDNNGNPGAGRFVGEFVAAGTPLGLEGDVGFASGPHVHFEVAVPYHVELPPDNASLPDPDSPLDGIVDWFTGGGFLVGDGVTDDVDSDGSDDVNRQNRIPVFCQVGFANAGDTNTAGPCTDTCDDPIPDVSGLTIASGSLFYDQDSDTIGNPAGDFIVQPFAGAALRAGTRVTLSPGFHAQGDSYFSASIGACDTPGGVGE